ncbi:MAG: DUF5683 domain-containing protein [Capnocytophaga sp.]|nr:DUF5683 domain-containing protein [Capnocytophaga sp.]
MNRSIYLILTWIFVLYLSKGWAQEKPVEITVDTTAATGEMVIAEMNKITWNTDPLSPAKAAFYSAILPGLGQIYNKSYWKVPLVFGGIGTGVYFYVENSKQFDRYQTAYKRRVQGFTDDEFYGDRADGQPRLSTDGLRRAQQFYKRNKELSLLITVGLYALNIVEANVDAHLKQFNVDENISFEPYFETNELNFQPQYGLTMKIKF